MVHRIICSVDSPGMILVNTGFRTQSFNRVGTAMKMAIPTIIRVRGKRRIFRKMDLGGDAMLNGFVHLTLQMDTGYDQI